MARHIAGVGGQHPEHNSGNREMFNMALLSLTQFTSTRLMSLLYL